MLLKSEFCNSLMVHFLITAVEMVLPDTDNFLELLTLRMDWVGQGKKRRSVEDQLAEDPKQKLVVVVEGQLVDFAC